MQGHLEVNKVLVSGIITGGHVIKSCGDVSSHVRLVDDRPGLLGLGVCGDLNKGNCSVFFII